MKLKSHIHTMAALAASLCFTASCSKEGGGGPADGIPLSTKLPQELSVGTPRDLSKVANLDPNKKPDPVKVPKDAKLLSAKKPVTSSDKEEPFEGSLDMITDGEKDGNEGYSVILGEGPQWVQIDLEKSALVDAVVLWHYFKNDRVVYDVVVQVSDDPEFKSGVTTVFNNDTDDSLGQGKGGDKGFIGVYLGKQIAANGAKGRYVRCWSNGSTENKLNEYIEVEVWGRE